MNKYEKQANVFLKKTGTEFKTEFKRFGSMDWDKNGEERNIFSITLSNSRGSYTFDFGSSLADSLKEATGINPKGEYDCNGAYKIANYIVTFGKNFTGQELIDGVGFSDEYITDDQQKMLIKLAGDFNKKTDKLHKRSQSFLLEEKKYDYARDFVIHKVPQLYKEAFEKTVEKASQDRFLSGQKEPIVHPTAYDVLACITKYDPGTFENFCDDFGYDTDSRSAERTYNAVVQEWLQISALFSEQELEELRDIQ